MTQKIIIAKANLAGKPVIVATQMLESMVSSRLPTRAEATDVANAILDGTDCVMLSGESAMGRYPEEAVRMLTKIASYTEAHRPHTNLQAIRELCEQDPVDTPAEGVSKIVQNALDTFPACAVFVPTRSGTTARMLSRFKPHAWIVAACADPKITRTLLFSYGVHAIGMEEEPEDWAAFATAWLKKEFGCEGSGILISGPSASNPKANHRMEFLKF